MVKKDFEINGGGTGLVFFSTLSVIFWLLCIPGFPKQLSLKEIAGFVGYILLCLYFSIFSFKFWKSNFVKIKAEELLISVLDRKQPRIWPKFNKKSIRLNDIECVSLEKPAKIYLAPVLTIKIKSSNPYNIDTKPFSKAAFWKLFKEFEKKGIEVQITEGAI